MDATCAIQASIHVFSLVRKYVSRILGTYHATWCDFLLKKAKNLNSACGVQIPQCGYCKSGQSNKCLWRVSSIFQVVELESLLYTQQFIDLNEVNYITEYMKNNLAC